MRLPNAERAVVEERKLKEYILSRSHPIGRFKATVFEAAGFDLSNWRELAGQLQTIAKTPDAELGETSPYGQKYLIPGTLTATRGTPLEVVTVWIIRSNDDTPRLVTVYPR